MKFVAGLSPDLHIKEQHKDEIDSLKCSFCQRTFVRSFNLKKHYRVIHKLDGKDLKCAMEYKKFTVNRQRRVYLCMCLVNSTRIYRRMRMRPLSP